MRTRLRVTKYIVSCEGQKCKFSFSSACVVVFVIRSGMIWHFAALCRIMPHHPMSSCLIMSDNILSCAIPPYHVPFPAISHDQTRSGCNSCMIMRDQARSCLLWISTSFVVSYIDLRYTSRRHHGLCRTTARDHVSPSHVTETRFDMTIWSLDWVSSHSFLHFRLITS